MYYFISSIYFFNCLELGPNIILSCLSISTIPLAPSPIIASLLTLSTSSKVTINLDKLTSVSFILSCPTLHLFYLS